MKKSHDQSAILRRSSMLCRYIFRRLAPPQIVDIRQGVTRTLGYWVARESTSLWR